MSRKLEFYDWNFGERLGREMDFSVKAIRIHSISQEVNIEQDRGSKTQTCVETVYLQRQKTDRYEARVEHRELVKFFKT